MCILPLIRDNQSLQQNLLMNNYEVLWDIDLGGSEFCRVKLGKCRKSGKFVAIKIITKTFFPNIEKEILSYINDSFSNNNSYKELKGENNCSGYFPQIFDTFEDYDFIYIVMELNFGGELYHLLVRSDNLLDEEIVSLIFFQVCSAINFLHSIGVTHGDIKAENIMFSKINRLDSIKILDFGSSFFLYSNKNSPGYVKKEFCRLFNKLDSKIGKDKELYCFDFWSCGKLLYLMLTGKYLDIDFDEYFFIENDIKNKIYGSEELNCSFLAKDLLYKLLSYNIHENEPLTMEILLKHPWFKLGKNADIFNIYISPHDELIKSIF